jgi:hypothetical protein
MAAHGPIVRLVQEYPPREPDLASGDAAHARSAGATSIGEADMRRTTPRWGMIGTALALAAAVSVCLWPAACRSRGGDPI